MATTRTAELYQNCFPKLVFATNENRSEERHLFAKRNPLAKRRFRLVSRLFHGLDFINDLANSIERIGEKVCWCSSVLLDRNNLFRDRDR